MQRASITYCYPVDHLSWIAVQYQVLNLMTWSFAAVSLAVLHLLCKIHVVSFENQYMNVCSFAMYSRSIIKVGYFNS